MTPIVNNGEFLDKLVLAKGSHADHKTMCVMEAAAYIAGEPWSDSPQCASPTITAFMINWNDSLRSDEERTRLLKPLIKDLIDTRTSAKDERVRSYMALDWLTRTFLPTWLDLVPALADHAKAVRGLPEIVDLKTANKAGPIVRAARDAARDAARAAAGAAAMDAAGAAARAAAGDAAWDAAMAAAGDAAWDVARDAAWAAAGDAARDAAWAAARDAAMDAAGDAAMDAAGAAAMAAAGDAAWDAAWAAARDAAMDAAGDAAWDALAPTAASLQTSAQDLVRRMCAVGRTA